MIRTFSVIALIANLMVAFPSASEKPSREYEVKGGYLYNFLNFTDWPDEAPNRNSEAITIGIYGKDSFGDIFEQVEGSVVKGRTLEIRRFEKNESFSFVGECDLLFISNSETGQLDEILKACEEKSVLTVGESSGFLEAGGIINLVEKDNTIKFEVNVSAARESGLVIGSKLLKIATRVLRK
jgi:hypothetical protein